MGLRAFIGYDISPASPTAPHFLVNALPRPPISLLVCLSAALALASLGACQKTTSKVLGKISMKTPISQGNLMFREDIARVRLGMGKEEVRFILGSPMLTGSFEENRWYYLFFLNLRPISESNPDRKPIVFAGEQGAVAWESYWRSPEPVRAYGGKPSSAVPGLAGDKKPKAGEDDSGEAKSQAEEGAEEKAEEAEEVERITTIRRDRFVESEKGYIAGRNIVFYGRMSLQFEGNRLVSIDLLETPELSPSADK